MSAPLTLSPGDQRRLVAASVALLSPLAYPDADAWRRDVCDRVRALLGADRLIFVLPKHGKADPFSEDYDLAVMAEYADQIRPVADSLHMFERLGAIGAGTRPMIYDDMDAFYRSPYWNEYARPQGALDSLTASVPVGPSPMLAHHAQLLANHDTPHAAPFGDHEVGLARLLLPALQTGALAWQRLAGVRGAFTTLIDSLSLGALVFDADGAELHRNPAASRLLGVDPGGVAAVASRMARAIARPGPGGPPHPVGSGRLVVRAVPLSPELCGRGGLSLVTVEPAGEPAGLSPPDAESLRDRFGLTRQQSRVALLLAGRRSTAEIAGALSISVHTVRRHTEAVLERLGVASRTEVDRVIRGEAASAPAGWAENTAPRT